jgi:hypothetical protein
LQHGHRRPVQCDKGGDGDAKHSHQVKIVSKNEVGHGVRTAAVMIPTRPTFAASKRTAKVSVAALIMRAVARPYQTGSDEAA